MMRHLMFIYVLIFILTQGDGFTEDLSLHERYLENVQRLARLEEGQKTIIEKFEAVDQRFEAVDQRFEAMNKQFEAMNKQFEAVDQRFDSLTREMNQRFEAVDQRFDSLIREMNQRFETLDKRIDLIANHVSNLDNHFLTILVAIIGLIAYIIWDRKTAFDGVYKKIEQLFQSHIE